MALFRECDVFNCPATAPVNLDFGGESLAPGRSMVVSQRIKPRRAPSAE